MKKFIYSLAILIALGSCFVAEGFEASNDNDDNSSSLIHYGIFYTQNAQIGIAPNQIITITNQTIFKKSKFKISDNGGVIIPSRGSYSISYRVLTNSQVSLALFKNNEIIPESAFANTAASPISGTVIVSLRARDIITIRSIETAKTFNTVSPVSTSFPTIPVNMNIQIIGN